MAVQPDDLPYLFAQTMAAQPLAGNGKNQKVRTDSNGKVTFHLPDTNSFAVYQYVMY